jgi:hypothetical protein
MNTNAIKVIASIAWAAAAISTATPASAIAQTPQTGAYATCTSSWEPHVFGNCNGQFNYTQHMKLNTVSCNSSTCQPYDWNVFVEFLYSMGRNKATLQTSCTTANIYVLSPCEC